VSEDQEKNIKLPPSGMSAVFNALLRLILMIPCKLLAIKSEAVQNESRIFMFLGPNLKDEGLQISDPISHITHLNMWESLAAISRGTTKIVLKRKK